MAVLYIYIKLSLKYSRENIFFTTSPTIVIEKSYIGSVFFKKNQKYASFERQLMSSFWMSSQVNLQVKVLTLPLNTSGAQAPGVCGEAVSSLWWCVHV